MRRVRSVANKIGIPGVLLSALSCATCFPALGVFAAVIGVGFLSHAEGVAINYLLPGFAGLALVFAVLGWFEHRIHWRGVMATFGPGAVLATLYPLWQYPWSTWLFYLALIIMVVSFVVELAWPMTSACPKPEPKA